MGGLQAAHKPNVAISLSGPFRVKYMDNEMIELVISRIKIYFEFIDYQILVFAVLR